MERKNKIKSTVNDLDILSKKIQKVQKVIYQIKFNKLRINMTTKDSSRKKFLVSISLDKTNKIIALFNKHVANINRALKKIKSEVIVDFI